MHLRLLSDKFSLTSFDHEALFTGLIVCEATEIHCMQGVNQLFELNINIQAS